VVVKAVVYEGMGKAWKKVAGSACPCRNHNAVRGACKMQTDGAAAQETAVG